MSWQPTATLHQLKARAGLYRQIRAFFHARGVLEVETPALSQAGNTDPAIHSFSVATASGMRYLHTSPEYPMKRLLAAGSGDIYQICKVWRQDESGTRHNPEFSMLEYYRVGFSYRQLMAEVATLLHQLIPNLNPTPELRSYRQAFQDVLHLDPYTASLAELQACAQRAGLAVQSELSRQGWYDLLFSHCVEPCFPRDRLSFICHYPATQAALASLQMEDGYPVAERFEVYLGALELGNGYQEQTDAQQLAQVLQLDAQQHSQHIPVDTRFIAGMQAGLPRCAGIALGLDRILMCAQAEPQLQRVLSFGWEIA